MDVLAKDDRLGRSHWLQCVPDDMLLVLCVSSLGVFSLVNPLQVGKLLRMVFYSVPGTHSRT